MREYDIQIHQASETHYHRLRAQTHVFEHISDNLTMILFYDALQRQCAQILVSTRSSAVVTWSDIVDVVRTESTGPR